MEQTTPSSSTSLPADQRRTQGIDSTSNPLTKDEAWENLHKLIQQHANSSTSASKPKPATLSSADLVDQQHVKGVSRAKFYELVHTLNAAERNGIASSRHLAGVELSADIYAEPIDLQILNEPPTPDPYKIPEEPNSGLPPMSQWLYWYQRRPEWWIEYLKQDKKASEEPLPDGEGDDLDD